MSPEIQLRDDDHQATREWLGALEAGETKALHAPVFSAGGGTSGAGWSGTQFYHAWQPGAKRDYAAEAGDIRRNSLIAAGLAWIGKNFAEPTPRVERRNSKGDWEEVVDHPLTRLIRRPNPYQSWQTLAKAAIADYKAFGDGFFLVAKSLGFRPGDPIELWWMPRQQVRPRWNAATGEFLGGWNYTLNGASRQLDTDEVLHFQDGIDPTNNRMGLAALQSCLREVCTDNEAANFTSGILRNSGVTAVMVSPLNPEHSFADRATRDQFAGDLEKRISGENAGKALVTNIALKADKLGSSPEELTLDKIRNVPEARLCSALGLNAMVLGMAVGETQKTYANYGESRKAAYEDCLLPDLKEWAYVIDRDLLPLLGDPSCERFGWDTSAIVALNESEDAKFTRAGLAFEKRLATQNEARAMVGLSPVPNGDVYADGSTPKSVASEEPAVPGAAVPALAGAGVQDLALNGAQITALAELVAEVAGGQMPSGSARGIILAAFPDLSTERVNAILDPLDAFKPTAAEPPPPTLAGASKPPPPVAGEDAGDLATKALMVRMEGALAKMGV